ncbi:hypothetical protein, partial [Candidatus Frankia alpina]|uniref:hypothetical protein n=1 Tax=Candidatus Frankia alpina TaxID=2699483 RepID=UPI0013871FE5
PAHLPDPLLLPSSDVATLRTLLRSLVPALRDAPATLTVGPLTRNGDLRPIRLSLGSRCPSDTLTVHAVVHSDIDPALRFPDLAAMERRFSDWGATDSIHLNPRYLTDAAKLTHHGRPVSRHAGLTLHFRAARSSGTPGPVRITHPDRPSFTADVMPIHRSDQ